MEFIFNKIIAIRSILHGGQVDKVEKQKRSLITKFYLFCFWRQHSGVSCDQLCMPASMDTLTISLHIQKENDTKTRYLATVSRTAKYSFIHCGGIYFWPKENLK